MLDFLTKSKEKNESFWALLIEPEWITSAIWQVTNGKVEITNASPSTRYDAKSVDEGLGLTDAVDASLSSCTQNLPEEADDPTKTVFGVPNSWIAEGNIKDEYLGILKKLCEDLSLVPSGFVVLSEAISHFVKQEEESPLSGIVAGISSENIDLSIFNLGKLVGTTTILRSVSVEDDMVEGLSRLGVGLESFPSRIILFNQNEQELEEIKNSLNGANWEVVSSSKFIHTPRIEVFDPSKKIMAVALAGGSELGEVDGVVVANAEEKDTETENLPIEEVNNFEEPDAVTAADLGFVINNETQPEKPSNAAPLVENELPVHHTKSFKLPEFKFKKPNFNYKFGNKPLIMGGSLLTTFFVVAILLWWFLPTASITVYVSPQKIEEVTTIDIGSDLNSKDVEVNVNGEKTKSTTGTKTVGERSKGQIKIQNGTAFPISLPSGTVLLSSGDLKFVTTKSASVSGALTPSTPGTATIDIEAGNIGSEYNLSKSEVFKVSNFPKAEVDGTAVDNLTGGSSRQISAVSEDDRKSLLKSLTEELANNAKGQLSEKINEDEMLVESSVVTEIDEEDFSNKLNDEASNLKLNLSLIVKAKVVSKSALSSVSKKSLESKVPEGFVLKDDQIIYDFTETDEADSFNLKISANLLPNVNPFDIAKKIAGKFPKIAEDYLVSVPGYARAEIRVTPLLPGKLGTLPHISKNINVTISADR